MLTQLSGVKTAQEALVKSGLAWGIREGEVYDATGKLIPTHKSLTRSDTGERLAVVRKSYQWIDNSTFGFCDALCRKHNAEYVSGGSLDGGRRVFLSLSLGGAEIQRDDEVRNNVIISNSFDGGSAFCALSSPIRLVCSNQLSRAVRESTMSIAVRHTSGAQERALAAFRLFDLSMVSFGVFVNKARLLSKKSVSDKQVKLFVDTMIPDSGFTRSKNARQRVVELFHTGKGNEGRPSAWTLVNGLVEHLDWDGNGEQDRLIDSRLFGYRAAMKSKAFDLALAL
jgi:phage/plasmid-like protein (TIGR03299 family)